MIATVASTAALVGCRRRDRAVSVAEAGETRPPASPLADLLRDSSALRSLAISGMAHEMLDQVEHLPILPPRTLYVGVRPDRAVDLETYDRLSDVDRRGLERLDVDSSRYYTTFYGSPLVYARILDLAAEAWGKTGGPSSLRNLRIVDLGYGQLGQVRLWAQMGASVTGVDVNPILTSLYRGSAALGPVGLTGSLRLLECAWPNTGDCRELVGEGYDLFVSRNLLKNGYVNAQEVRPDLPVPVAWGMSGEEATTRIFELLRPGGLAIIYSIGPTPDPRIPMSDIGNPWPRSAWEAAGFDVLDLDADETLVARAYGQALRWDRQMNLQGLFGVRSVFYRPKG